MPVGKSSFANSAGGGSASRSKEIPRRTSSKGSINFDACNSPDFNSVALGKELADLDIEDQVPFRALLDGWVEWGWRGVRSGVVWSLGWGGVEFGMGWVGLGWGKAGWGWQGTFYEFLGEGSRRRHGQGAVQIGHNEGPPPPPPPRGCLWLGIGKWRTLEFKCFVYFTRGGGGRGRRGAWRRSSFRSIGIRVDVPHHIGKRVALDALL
jgi:hypothetical protein